jgi:hypothetical protein
MLTKCDVRINPAQERQCDKPTGCRPLCFDFCCKVLGSNEEEDTSIASQRSGILSVFKNVHNDGVVTNGFIKRGFHGDVGRR